MKPIMKKPVTSRLKELRNRAGLSVRALAEKLGYDSHTTYAHYESKEYKKSYLPPDLVGSLARVLPSFGIDEAEILQLGGLTSVTNLRPAERDRPKGIDDSQAKIVELDIRATGGTGAINDNSQEAVVAEWQMPKRLLFAQTSASPDNLKIITVYGDSMAPDFLPGERIMVDTDDRVPSPPGVFVMWDGFGLIVKRMEMIPYSDPPMVRLVSRNSAYEPRELSSQDVIINGRVIGKWLWT